MDFKLQLKRNTPLTFIIIYKYRKMKTLNIFIAILGLSIISCEKTEPDTTKPVITLESPTSEEVHIGDTLHLHALFSDDVALGSFQIEIHEGGEHSHGRSEFDWDTTGTLSGTAGMVHTNIDIPETAEAGEYHLIINCTDSAGNAADILEFDLHFESDTTDHK